MVNFWRNTFGIGPSRGQREDQQRRGDEQRQREEQTEDPYGKNAPAWDSSGFPEGRMPAGRRALDYQYEANRRAEERRRMLWGDAQQSMRQGLDLFQSYRPGGAAAVASGMFGQQASLYGTQALNTEAPDLLIDYREQIRESAERETRQLNRNAQLISGFSSFNFLAGGTPSPLQPAPEPVDPKSNISTAPGGSVPAVGGVQPQLGSGTGFGPTPTGSPQPTSPGAGAGGVDTGMGGGPGGSQARGLDRAGAGATVDGAYGASGAGAGGGPGGGGPGGSRARGAGAGNVGGGATGAGESTSGLGTFTGNEVAGAAMAQSPRSLGTTTDMWAGDASREESTALMQSSARKSLLDAISLFGGSKSTATVKSSSGGSKSNATR